MSDNQQASGETEAERVHFAEPGHYTDSDREKIPESHFAGPDRTYPIEVPKDVEDAATLVGHAADPEAVKRRIIAIAHEMGAAFVARLPKEWTEGESEGESERAILAAEVTRSASLIAAPEVDDMPETSTDARIFAPITRIDTERREVIVTATSEAVDSYNTRFAYEASKDAFERWAGNIREMHQPKAVGSRVAVLPDDEERKIRVRLRISKGAEDTWQKVLDGTLRGASIGASNVQWEVPESRAQGERPIPVARKYDLVELSLVDSASNPDSNGVQIVRSVRLAGVDEQGVITPDAAILDDLDSAADVADPVTEPVTEAAPEAVAEPVAEPVAAEPVVTEAPRSLTATPGWRPDREDYATFLARQRLEANQAGLPTASATRASAPEPAGMQVTPVDPELAAHTPQTPAAVYAPSRYPDHIRAAAAAAGEEAVARMPGYQAGVSGHYATYLQRMAQVRGAAEMTVYAEYAEGERAARAAASAPASQGAPAKPSAQSMDSDGDHDGDEDEAPAKAPALSAKANATANKQVQQEANAEQDDADSIADDNSGVKKAQDEDEAPERAEMPEEVREGITTATGLQGYEMDGQGSASGKLNGSAMSGTAQRHRHSHGGDSDQIHTHDHEHTHPNGTTHSHPHAHGHAEAFSGGEHSHMHGHQHAFRNGQPTDTRLASAPMATGSQGANMPDEERAGLSQTGLKSNIQPTSNSGPKPAGATKGADGLSSPVLAVSPQKVGALSVVDTEEPMARDGGVPEPAEPEATPDDLTLNGEDFHEGGHESFSQAGNKLDIDGDHDEPGDGDEDENGKQGEADTPIVADGALQHAAPSAIGAGRPTPKNSGSPARSVEEAEEQRIGARISGASRDRLHKMRDNHRGSMLDVAELCGCPECKGHLMVLNGGMLDMGQDADHDGGASDAPDSGDDFVKIGQERMQRLVARAVNDAVRGLFAETLRMLTQSQAEHLSALTAEFADARTQLETRMQDLELGLQDATSNLASNVETRFAQPDATAQQVAPETVQMLSQLETRMGDVSRAVSESQQQITERMNAIAEVASELQASVARIESQPAPTQPLPGSGAAVKGLPYQNTEALRGLGVAGSGAPDGAALIAQLTALAQHPDIRSNVKSQTAIAEQIMRIQAAGR